MILSLQYLLPHMLQHDMPKPSALVRDDQVGIVANGNSNAFVETSAHPAGGRVSAPSDPLASRGRRHSGTSAQHLTQRSAQSLVTQLGHQPDPKEPSRHQRHGAILSDDSLRDAPSG